MPTRRDLLAAMAVPIPPPHGWSLAPAPDDRLVLTEAAGPTRILLPAGRCRKVLEWEASGHSLAAIRFAAQTRTGESIDLLMVAGAGRILALEPCGGVASDGAHFATRPDLPPGGSALVLRRDAAIPHHARTVWERESWTDILDVTDAALADAPARPPLAGTWQAAVAARRAIILDRLHDRPTGFLDPSLLAAVASWPWDQAAS